MNEDRGLHVTFGSQASKDKGPLLILQVFCRLGAITAEVPASHPLDVAFERFQRDPIKPQIEEERLDQYLRLDEVKTRLERRWTLNANDANTGGPARYWDIAETGGRLGLITPHTGNFCEGCNRLRVTATGQIYPCLGGAERVDLRAALRSDNPDNELAEALGRALMVKPEKHHFRMDERGRAPHLPRHMSMTGG